MEVRVGISEFRIQFGIIRKISVGHCMGATFDTDTEIQYFWKFADTENQYFEVFRLRKKKFHKKSIYKQWCCFFVFFFFSLKVKYKLKTYFFPEALLAPLMGHSPIPCRGLSVFGNFLSSTHGHVITVTWYWFVKEADVSRNLTVENHLF
jgi:hypothetical protein